MAKTQLMAGGNIKAKDLSSLSIMVDGIMVSPTKEIELFGGRFDTKFSTAPHDTYVATVARQRGSLIARLAHHLARGKYLRQLARGLFIGVVVYAVAAIVPPRLKDWEASPQVQRTHSRPGCAPLNRDQCLEKHPKECVFRKVECPARKCLQIMPLEDVCQHLDDFHPRTTIFTTIVSDRLTCRFPVNVGNHKGPHNSFDHSWIYDKLRFFARFQQVYPTWFAWVYVLGNEEVAKRYYCQITAVSAEETPLMKIRTQYTGPIHPIDTPKKQVRTRSSASLQLSDLVVDKYRNHDVSFEEKENGFNSFLRIDFKLRPVLGARRGCESSSASSTPGLPHIQVNGPFFK
eukprot:maker-scaffold817_size93049-snap-gene-0.11 protein:Tk02222 transcript:maker-scaffold817_size93049-snap-gene-0.11-mRNA-1 annotation:"y3509_dicdi ame: full"